MKARDQFPSNQYPFSDALCAFMDACPEFLKSLKVNNPERFFYLPVVIWSHPPLGEPHAEDEVLGLWSLDKENLIRLAGDRARAVLEKKPFFKQDFIVNVGRRDREFVSYTATALFEGIRGKTESPFVRPIDDFFEDYGKGKVYYHREGKSWQHWYPDVEDLPAEVGLREAGQTAKDLILASLAGLGSRDGRVGERS